MFIMTCDAPQAATHRHTIRFHRNRKRSAAAGTENNNGHTGRIRSHPAPLPIKTREFVIGSHHSHTGAGVGFSDDLTPLRIIYWYGVAVRVRKHTLDMCRMRAVSAMVFLALCGLLVIIYQAVQQELNIRNLKTRIAVSGHQVKLKEDGILAAKTKVEEMNKNLNPLITQRDQLKKQKDDIKKGNAISEKELGTCQAEKGKLEKQSNGAKDSLQKLKEDQEAERKKAEEEIGGLKQQALERDLRICKYVDITLDEPKKLCAGTI